MGARCCATKERHGGDRDDPMEDHTVQTGTTNGNAAHRISTRNATESANSFVGHDGSPPGTPQTTYELWWPPIYIDARQMAFQGFLSADLSEQQVDPATNPVPGDVLVLLDGEKVEGMTPDGMLCRLGGLQLSVVQMEFARAGPGGGANNVKLSMKRSCPDRPIKRQTSLAGLKNPSNCCFMNATLQCCAHSYPDLHSISGRAVVSKKSGLPRQDINVWGQDVEAAVAYSELCTAITSSNGKVIDTANFRKTISPRVDIVVPPQEYQVQEDAHQFLVFLWSAIDNALSRDGGRGRVDPKARKDLENKENSARKQLNDADMTQPDDYAPAVELMATLRWDSDCEPKDKKLMQLMWGQYAKGIGCPTCMMWVDVKPELYNVLEVPVPDPSDSKRKKKAVSGRISLDDCIKMFFDQEKTDKGTKCPRCKYPKGVEQKYVLLRLPECLAIVLKRYTYKANYQTIEKNNAPIIVPEVIDMKEHVFQTGSSLESTVYTLMGQVVHLGSSPRSGHYVAHVRHEGKWWRISDGKVALRTAEDETEALSNAYILFYRRNRLDNVMPARQQQPLSTLSHARKSQTCAPVSANPYPSSRGC